MFELLKITLAIFIYCTVFSLQAQPAVKTYQNDTPQSIAFIGNSFFYYNNGITTHLRPMVAEGSKGMTYRDIMLTIGGSGLDWHDVESYFRPNAVARYRFDNKNNVIFSDADKKIFDTVILMDCSQCPIHPTLSPTFIEYAKKHSDTARKHGATPVFFMSWAYQDKPEMTKQLADAYTRAGNLNKALVIPVGLAFERSIMLRPEINLYSHDKRHPSLAGTYLSAVVTYATLFNNNPVGLKYTAGLPQDVVDHLQKIARDSVNEYLNR